MLSSALVSLQPVVDPWPAAWKATQLPTGLLLLAVEGSEVASLWPASRAQGGGQGQRRILISQQSLLIVEVLYVLHASKALSHGI